MSEQTDEMRPGDTKLELSLFLLDTAESDVSSFYQELVECVESLTQGYIWNNEKFELSKPVMLGKDENIYVCHGRVDFGDNIDDEWFIVYLLFELSRLYRKRWHKLFVNM